MSHPLRHLHTLSCTVPEAVYRALLIYARERELSMHALLRLIAEDYVERRAEQHA